MVGPVTLSKDALFHVLQSSRRRAVMRYLLDHPEQDQFRHREITEAVAAWEAETTVSQLSADQRQRMYVALYQTHLPTLNEYGVIAYNQDRGIVEPTPHLTVFDSYLGDGLRDDDDHLTPATDEAETEPDTLTTTVTSFFSN